MSTLEIIKKIERSTLRIYLLVVSNPSTKGHRCFAVVEAFVGGQQSNESHTGLHQSSEKKQQNVPRNRDDNAVNNIELHIQNSKSISKEERFLTNCILKRQMNYTILFLLN